MDTTRTVTLPPENEATECLLRLAAAAHGGDALLMEAADELAALRKDAARIDYIASNARCDPKVDGQHVWWPTSFNHRLTGPTLREAIDAAMASKRDGAA